MSDPVRDALRVSWATVVWSLASGSLSVIVGIADGALSLGGLGASVLIDVVSSAVLIWRFRHQRTHGEFPERAERLAQRVAAIGLFAISLTLIATSVQHLVVADHPDVSWLAVILAAVNVAVLPLLAGWKYGVADRVGSLALRTDAVITGVGWFTAIVSVFGLVLARRFDWWWADPVAALAVAAIAGALGRKALSVSAPPDELQA